MPANVVIGTLGTSPFMLAPNVDTYLIMHILKYNLVPIILSINAVPLPAGTGVFRVFQVGGGHSKMKVTYLVT